MCAICNMDVPVWSTVLLTKHSRVLICIKRLAGHDALGIDAGDLEQCL